jgi:hypothetical protein
LVYQGPTLASEGPTLLCERPTLVSEGPIVEVSQSYVLGPASVAVANSCHFNELRNTHEHECNESGG